jgi:hypothetical protein
MLSHSICISMAPLTKTIKEITEKADNFIATSNNNNDKWRRRS